MVGIKRFALSVILVLLFFGCATTTISQVEDKWGPPAKVEDRGDTIVYYYYFYKGKGIGYDPGESGGIVWGQVTGGWIVVEIITDRNGKILKKRKYWKQPEIK
jgi:hypothetical protein